MPIDKNNAMLQYLLTCEPINGSTLYFNFANAKDAITQFITLSNDRNIDTPYIDGSVRKRYALTVMSWLSISDNPIVKVEGFDNENISDIAEVQTLMDWINEQETLKNYPDFGEDIEVEAIRTTSNNPRLDEIDATSSPALARYSFTIQVDYIDYSLKLWNN